MDEEIQNIRAGGKRYVMDSQSNQLNEDQDAKDENHRLGAKTRRAKNQVGRGYIDNPNQQKILKKNQEIQKLEYKIALGTFKGEDITDEDVDLFMDKNPDFGEQ